MGRVRQSPDRPVTLPARVSLREVGPRDGLQGESPIPAELRARLVRTLVEAGVERIEAVSFVSPKAVPAMAHPDEVLREIGDLSGVRITALVPNRTGAELALAAGVDEITVTVAVSAAYNERNVHMSVDESIDVAESICSLAHARHVSVDAVVSCAFGSPYEGDIAPAAVALVCDRLRRAGVDALTLADTTGMATPRVVGAVLDETGPDVGLHLHETRGTGLVNSYAAMALGVTRFDTSIGGLGGSPFADGAGGNVSTEDFVALLDDLGVATGIDLDRLLLASALVEQLVGRAVPSRVAHAGPRLGRSAGSR